MKKFQISLMKKFKKTAIVVVCAVALAAIPPVSNVSATTMQEAQDSKNEAEGNKKDAQNVLDGLQERQNQLISDVEVLDKQVSDIQTKITAKEEEEDQLNTEIDDTKKKLAEAQVEEDNQYAAMMKRIQYLYENGEVEYIDTLMSSASFTDMLNKSEYVEQISSYDQKQLNALIQTRQDIQDYEATLEKDLKEVESVKADLETEKDNLNTTITEKNNKIAEYSKDIDAQAAMVEQYQKEIDAADAEMAAIQKRLDEQRAAAEAVNHSTIHQAVVLTCGLLHREAGSVLTSDQDLHLQQVQVRTIRELIFHVQPVVILLHQQQVQLLYHSTAHLQDTTS